MPWSGFFFFVELYELLFVFAAFKEGSPIELITGLTSKN